MLTSRFSAQELSEQLEDEEEASAELSDTRKKMEAEMQDLKADIDDLEASLKKVSRAHSCTCPPKWTFIPCDHLDFVAAVTARNDEFKAA